MLYTYNKALLYSVQYKYTQALEYLLKTEAMAKELGYYETGIYYNLALTYSQMEIDHMTLYFANALEGFKSEYKFRNIINCKF